MMISRKARCVIHREKFHWTLSLCQLNSQKYRIKFDYYYYLLHLIGKLFSPWFQWNGFLWCFETCPKLEFRLQASCPPGYSKKREKIIFTHLTIYARYLYAKHPAQIEFKTKHEITEELAVSFRLLTFNKLKELHNVSSRKYNEFPFVL